MRINFLTRLSVLYRSSSARNKWFICHNIDSANIITRKSRNCVNTQGIVLHFILTSSLSPAYKLIPWTKVTAQRASYSANAIVAGRTCVACEESRFRLAFLLREKRFDHRRKRFVSRRATNLPRSVIRMRGDVARRPEEIPWWEIICLGIQAEFVSSRREAPRPLPAFVSAIR